MEGVPKIGTVGVNADSVIPMKSESRREIPTSAGQEPDGQESKRSGTQEREVGRRNDEAFWTVHRVLSTN